MTIFRIFFLCLFSLIILSGVRADGFPINDPGPEALLSGKLGEWVNGPDRETSQEFNIYLYGEGKFRVHLRSGDKVILRVVEVPLADWVSFKRTLKPGPSGMMVEVVPDSRYPNPRFEGLVVAGNPEFKPNLADFRQPLYLQAGNLSHQDVEIQVDGGRMDYSHPTFNLGFITAGGFAPKGVLPAGIKGPVLNLSREIRNRSRLTFKCRNAGKPLDVELRFFRDPGAQFLIRSFPVKAPSDLNEVILFYPQKDGAIRLINTDELFQENLKALETVDLSRPVPQKIWFLASYIQDNHERPETLRAEVELARKIGINGDFLNLGSLAPEKKASGPPFGFQQVIYGPPAGKGRRYTPELEENVAKNAPYIRKGFPSLAKLADEPGFAELAKNQELDRDFAVWMKNKGLTPKEAGVTTWDEVKVIAPLASKKRLSTLSHRFQMEEQIKFWNGFGAALKKLDPDLRPYVNWQANEYYLGMNIDLWELYRRPGLDIVWGEDWFQYMPRSSGVTAWYADLMRSQAKYRNLPTGTYPIIGHGGASPNRDLFKFYERLMRGCTVFNLYPYSPRGNENSWLDNSLNARTLARLSRDAAAVEDIVAGGRVLPAQIALVYPDSCMLWGRSAYPEALALYLAHLHAGKPMDILTEQDLVDGYGKDYRILYVVGANIRRQVLKAIETYIQEGGTVVCSSPDFRDEYDEPIANGPAVMGLANLSALVNEEPTRFAYEFNGTKPLDTVTWGKEKIEIYCQKSRLIPGPHSRILARFADGSPALLKSKVGKGLVYVYALAPGFSYLKADYGDNSGFPTVLCRNNKERDFATFIAAGLPPVFKVSETMIGGRLMAHRDAALLGLVDYGIGTLGRKKMNPRDQDIDFETMAPLPVTVEISCRKRPYAIYGVRSGEVKWSFQKGKVTVVLPMRGAELLVLKGKDLF
jgi:hypothetical protein